MAKSKSRKKKRVLPSFELLTPVADERLKIPVDEKIYAVIRPEWMTDTELWRQLQMEIKMHARQNQRQALTVKHKGGNFRVPSNRRSVIGYQFGEQPEGEYCVFV